MEVLRAAGISLAGKHAVVVGRSTIVGKPMALLLQGEDATVTMCHSRTRNLVEECSRADVLVAAAGKPHLIGADHVKPGAVVIDVGINRLEMNGKSKLVGDVDTQAVQAKASFVTPVPGGIGPMTIAMLLRNTMRAASTRATLARHPLQSY
ncbi:MAG: bifunctional methylenetetrahydrofolate dehydrogenase/methenyltetrahydrofolate cyclohydrolase, partial [Bdellovibrionales bacterium]|nr:bifunctional methylenetetrahydrofolate dehydrogenase/methenyltetrahydrofolate cyclohydrolase [Bdellovibrionales bacterium]